MSEKEIKTRFLRGHLEGLRENTAGGDPEIVALMHKLDVGLFRWIGKSPSNRPRRKK